MAMLKTNQIREAPKDELVGTVQINQIPGRQEGKTCELYYCRGNGEEGFFN
jgi:hydroxypyruvate isomerase